MSPLSKAETHELIAVHCQKELARIEQELMFIATLAQSIDLPEIADLLGAAISKIDEAQG